MKNMQGNDYQAGYMLRKKPWRANHVYIKRKDDCLRQDIGTLFITFDDKVYRYKKVNFGYGWVLDRELSGRIWHER